MKKRSCLLAALVLSLAFSGGCNKIEARAKIREANELYEKEKYAEALPRYMAAKKADPSFVDLDRMIGYCRIGMFVPDNDTTANMQHAIQGGDALRRYLRVRPNDETAREAYVNLLLNSNRKTEAIDYFKEYLKTHPKDLSTIRSVANLYREMENYDEALRWTQKITVLDARNPESFYGYGVFAFQMVRENPPTDPAKRLEIIEMGKGALARAIEMKKDYSEAMVFLNLLIREQIKDEPDPVKQQELLAQADEWRGKAIAINKARKAAKEAANAKKSTT